MFTVNACALYYFGPRGILNKHQSYFSNTMTDNFSVHIRYQVGQLYTL